MKSSNRKWMLLGGAWMMMAAAVWGEPAQVSKSPATALEVAVSYGAMHSNDVPGESFWMQGGSAQVHGQFWRGLGAVADIGGSHASDIHSSGIGLDLVTATFGPRYTWYSAHLHSAVFGQVLAGKAFGMNSTFPSVSGVSDTADSLALLVGGGLDIPVSHHLGVRAFEADWLRTQLPNGATNVQNNLRMNAGLTFRFK